MMSISAGTTASTEWTLTTDGDLFADVNGAAVYLIIDGTLKASPIPGTTKWEYNNGTFITAGMEGTLAYSVDKNEWNYIGAKKYYIKATGNDYYLAIDPTLKEEGYSNRGDLIANYISIVNTTSIDSAAKWTKSGTDDNMVLTTEITKSDGVTYTYHFAHFANEEEMAKVAVADRPQSEIHNNYTLKYENGSLYFARSNWDRYLTYTESGETVKWTKTYDKGGAQTIEFVEIPADASLKVATATNIATNGQKLVANATGTEKMNYDGNNVTYIPLQKDTEYNTGYIVSGIYSGRTGDKGNYSYGEGTDIRVSGYAKNDNIASDLKLYYHNGTNFTTYTIPTGTVTSNPNGWQKFISSYYGTKNDQGASNNDRFKNFINGDYVYGLHFMNGQISADSLVTIPTAYINNTEKINYQVPADCIDCHVSSKGFITFYAGTYFEGNDAFFSLHEIKRNDDNKISEIKQIYKIYEDSNGNYTYTYSADETASGKLVFDTSWITSPSYTDAGESKKGVVLNSLYYFEIPVNAGEYALGSVEGGTGAYLLYLDIGASLQDAASQNVDRTIIYEMFEEEVQDYTYAEGVGIMASTYETAASPNFSMTLNKNYGTDISLDRTGNSVTVSSEAAAAAEATLNSSGGFTVTGDNVTLNNQVGTKTITTKQVIYMDKNITAGETIIKTIIIWEDANGNGSVDEGEVTYETDGTWTTEPSTSGYTTTFQLSHHASPDSINWTDEGLADDKKIWSNLTTAILAYQYTPASDVTVTNTPIFTLADDGETGSYKVTVSATGPTTVTVTKNENDANTVEAGTNVTLTP